MGNFSLGSSCAIESLRIDAIETHGNRGTEKYFPLARAVNQQTFGDSKSFAELIFAGARDAFDEIILSRDGQHAGVSNG